MVALTTVGLSLKRRLKQSTNKPLVALTKKENDIWRELSAVTDALKAQATRVKTDDVKDSIERLSTLLNNYGKPETIRP